MAEQLTDKEGNGIGYACSQLVENNSLEQTDLVFYFDLGFPSSSIDSTEVTDEEREAAGYVQESLVTRLAENYGVSSGMRCSQPPIDNGSWMVKIVSAPTQYSRVEIFPTCRELEASTDQGCKVYEGQVSVWTFGKQDVPDVDGVIKYLLNSGIVTSNSTYRTAYLGKPVEDPETSTNPRDTIAGPDSVQEMEPIAEGGRRTVTIVGGLLVAAFGLAFLGLFTILYKRRQKFLQSRDIQLAVSKSGHFQRGSRSMSDEGEGKTLEPQTTSEDYMETLDQARSAEYPNNITFDLGNSFKDQLMGVHGRSSQNKLNMNHPFGMHHGSVDAASESDADSWAQTDGTIGSLELQLEPITAEV